MIEWDEVNGTYFEKFIFYVLGKMNFQDREWFGRGGGDEGRDIVAYTSEILPFNFSYQRKWIFQCKRWKKMPTTTQIINEVDTASQHKPDFWVLVIPVNPTPSYIDFFNRINDSKPFKVLYMPLVMLEEIIYTYPETKNILLQ